MKFTEPQKTLARKIERIVKKYQADNNIDVRGIVLEAGRVVHVYERDEKK